MIERVVENWLTNANERQYQIPFCQVLAAEGETIIYISPHGQMEQGKDVVTLGTRGDIRAYQLKHGKVTLKDWRSFYGEINELVSFPIEHPSVRSAKRHKSFLVTNGRVADPVLNSMRLANRAWARAHTGPLVLVARDELVSRFVKAHGRFLPQDPTEFMQFLDLIVNSGESQFDKKGFSVLLERVLSVDSSRNPGPRNLQRTIASAVLLTTYILQGCERVKNHWAIFEAWTMMAAYIGSLTSKWKTPDQWWETSLALCVVGASRALDNLAEECVNDQRRFTQGNPLTDGTFYGARITILSGLLGAASLSHRLRRKSWSHGNFVHQFLLDYLPKVRVWGESSVPYLVLAAIAIEKHGHHSVAESLILQLVREIAQVNGAKGRGMPNPYYEPEEALRIMTGFGDPNAEVFAGHSFTLKPLIQYLTRHWVRRNLAVVWDKVTRIHFASFKPDHDWESFRWRSRTGSLITSAPGTPQSWAELLKESESPPAAVPNVLRRAPELALYFPLVYPHRFTTESLKIIETAVGAV